MSFGPIERTPNLVLFVTDQQRALQHFPAPWVAANLKNLQALTRSGLRFPHAITNTCRCSPSRAVLMTGLLAPKTELVDVGGTLSMQWQTLGQRLQEAVPDIQLAYVGKWHMSASFTEPATKRPLPERTLEAENQLLDQGYRLPGWDAPDAGTAASWAPSTPPADPTVEDPYVSTANTLGGGSDSTAQNDARIVADALAALEGFATDRPFALIVSLVNPHDVWVDMYAELLAQAYPEFPAAFDALPHSDLFELPPSYDEDDLSTKPKVQTETRNSYTETWYQGHDLPVPADHMLDEAAALTYLKFYAYLTYLADQKLAEVYAALKQREDFDDTLIVRIADHGEMGMSHGGSMEKNVNVYAETLHIPYIFSNPKLWPEPRQCPAQAGLVDILPTLMRVYGQALGPDQVQGRDLSGLLLEPEFESDDSESHDSDCSIFTYDDQSDWHIRAIQAAAGSLDVGDEPTTPPYKYAVYYKLTQGSHGEVDLSSLEYELYVPGEDGEIDNLAPTNPLLCAALHAKLSARMAELDGMGPAGGGAITPPGWPAQRPSAAPG